ncbi:MAG: hypothetical protein JNK65_07710 [Deltaproteobacteria bacterium]|nr:hypothetical protein [Deltaproteobacteria bacterium]
MNPINNDFYQYDEVSAWIEQESSIHLKAVTKEGDPIELSAVEAEELASVLLAFSKKIRES